MKLPWYPFRCACGESCLWGWGGWAGGLSQHGKARLAQDAGDRSAVFGRYPSTLSAGAGAWRTLKRSAIPNATRRSFAKLYTGSLPWPRGEGHKANPEYWLISDGASFIFSENRDRRIYTAGSCRTYAPRLMKMGHRFLNPLKRDPCRAQLYKRSRGKLRNKRMSGSMGRGVRNAIVALSSSGSRSCDWLLRDRRAVLCVQSALRKFSRSTEFRKFAPEFLRLESRIDVVVVFPARHAQHLPFNSAVHRPPQGRCG